MFDEDGDDGEENSIFVMYISYFSIKSASYDSEVDSQQATRFPEKCCNYFRNNEDGPCYLDILFFEKSDTGLKHRNLIVISLICKSCQE